MSLFGSIQIANNSLFAAQTGLQVTGNNIANANTPGYLRQQVVLTPAPTQLVGTLPLGLGVQVDAIVQQTDRFLSERLRNATSDLAQSEMQENTYLQLEGIVGELGESDLSSSMSRFFAAINNVLNQPDDTPLRYLAATQGDILAQDIRRLSVRVEEMQSNINTQIAASAEEVNRLVQQVAQLNARIVTTEGGGTSPSDAVGLRDRRETALSELSNIIAIRTVEQQDGSVTVFAGGDYLVAQGDYRAVDVFYDTSTSKQLAYLHIVDSDSPLAASSGKLAGQYAARDEILGGFLHKLDSFTQTLVFEFNKVYASGQGLQGYQELTSQSAVDDTDAALDTAGLPYQPVNGSFQVLVRNTITGLTRTTSIPVDLNGLDNDVSLQDIAQMLNDVEGIQASISPENHLQIESEAADLEFGFAQDTSGLLAALGLNTFFTGSTTGDVGVNEAVRADPRTFAASQGGFGADADNALALADFANRSLETQNGTSLTGVYEQMIAETTQATAVAGSVSAGFRLFHHTLEGQQLGISGVSIDDEVVKMITYQRVYQASARFIAAIGELLEVLVNL